MGWFNPLEEGNVETPAEACRKAERSTIRGFQPTELTGVGEIYLQWHYKKVESNGRQNRSGFDLPNWVTDCTHSMLPLPCRRRPTSISITPTATAAAPKIGDSGISFF